MPTLVKQHFKPAPNENIMNALRRNMSNAYQSEIPDATKANLREVVQSLMDNTDHRNEFISALVNRIGMVIARTTTWENPLAKFKIGLLSYGSVIEEVQVGLLEAHTYDADRPGQEAILFGVEVPDVQSSFHTISRQNFYKITVNQALLQRAFLEENGLSAFIEQLMAAATTTDQHHEFLLMTQLFTEYEVNGGFRKVNVPDVSASTSTEANAKAFLRAVRGLAGQFQFIDTRFNAAAMPVAARPEDLELFISPEALAAIDVEALAAAFNTEYSNVPMRVTPIPRERFPDPRFQAILTTKDFFVVADTVLETRTVENGAGLHNNYFFHHHEIISASRFVPAVALWTGASTVDPVIETPVTDVTAITFTDRNDVAAATLARGEYYNIITEAVTDGDNKAVVLSLTGDKSNFTFITQEKTLYVGFDEAATSLSITATSTSDPTKTETKVVNLTGDIGQLWPNPQIIDLTP